MYLLQNDRVFLIQSLVLYISGVFHTLLNKKKFICIVIHSVVWWNGVCLFASRTSTWVIVARCCAATCIDGRGKRWKKEENFSIFNDYLAFLWNKTKVSPRGTLLNVLKHFTRHKLLLKLRDLLLRISRDSFSRKVKHSKTEDILKCVCNRWSSSLQRIPRYLLQLI